MAKFRYSGYMVVRKGFGLINIITYCVVSTQLYPQQFHFQFTIFYEISFLF